MRKQNHAFLTFPGLTTVLTAGLSFTLLSAAFAAGSGWYPAEHSQFRLISASGVPDVEKGALVAGVEIRLDEGWKTYWRTPGDGLATEIDITGSENLAEAQLLWPAPQRIEGAGGVVSYGYKGAVVLPILLKATDPGRPVILRTEMLYGVCADLCIPVVDSVELTIPAEDDSEYAADLADALRRIPYKQVDGDNCSHRFARARLTAGKDSHMLLIETGHDPQVTGRDLFVERENGLPLPPAELSAQPTEGQSVYAIRLENPDMATSMRSEQLVLTMTSDQGSCEVSWRVE